MIGLPGIKCSKAKLRDGSLISPRPCEPILCALLAHTDLLVEQKWRMPQVERENKACETQNGPASFSDTWKHFGFPMSDRQKTHLRHCRCSALLSALVAGTRIWRQAPQTTTKHADNTCKTVKSSFTNWLFFHSFAHIVMFKVQLSVNNCQPHFFSLLFLCFLYHNCVTGTSYRGITVFWHFYSVTSLLN